MQYATTHEVLKPLNEIMLPDPRFEIMIIGTPAEMRPFDVADLRERLALSVLNSQVPKEVQTQFQIALNLMLYTWYVFEFQTMAEKQAYAALELALRTRFPDATKRVRKNGMEKTVPITLGPLLRRAIADNVIVPEVLPAWARAKAGRKHFEEISPYPLAPMHTANQWLEHLIQTIPYFRNELAHGVPKLYLHGSFWAIELCGDLINSLFPIAGGCEPESCPGHA